MLTFESAIYLGNHVKVKEYSRTKHYGKLYCPECFAAALHYVNNPSTPHFSSNSKREHLEFCSHYSEEIPKTKLRKLLSEKNPESVRELGRLIEVGINDALRIMQYQELRKNKAKSSIKSDLGPVVFESSLASTKEGISRVHIKSLKSKKIENGDNIIVYGKGSIVLRVVKNNLYLGDLIAGFCVKDEEVFSVYLSKRRSQPDIFSNIEARIYPFAIFGCIERKGKFLNLKPYFFSRDIRFD
jgi:hypothetical protein